MRFFVICGIIKVDLSNNCLSSNLAKQNQLIILVNNDRKLLQNPAIHFQTSKQVLRKFAALLKKPSVDVAGRRGH